MLPQMLSAVRRSALMRDDLETTDREIDWLLRAGLGPMLYKLSLDNHRHWSANITHRLRASDLAARVQAKHMMRDIEAVVKALNESSIVPGLLKGLSYSRRYYPEPQLRLMGDVDLLLPGDTLRRAEEKLRSLGFEFRRTALKTSAEWEKSHHGRPLFHPGKRLWIELHTALLPGTWAAAHESPFDPAMLEQECVELAFGDQRVMVLGKELELLYLAAGWCKDLTNPDLDGLQRQLVDASLLLAHSATDFAWHKVLKWSKNNQSGACLLVLLSTLERHGGFSDEDRILPALIEAQPFVNRWTLEAINRMLDGYLFTPEPSPFLSRANMANRLDAAMRKRPAWTKAAAIPLRVLLPDDARRYDLTYQFGRMVSLCRRLRLSK